MFSNFVRYEILKNGTCSYCGRVADIIKLPDGDCVYSVFCHHCEAHNSEVEDEEAEIDYDEFYPPDEIDYDEF
jgi:hypothetical protein